MQPDSCHTSVVFIYSLNTAEDMSGCSGLLNVCVVSLAVRKTETEIFICNSISSDFPSVLRVTLLVGQQEWHLACNMLDVGLLVVTI